jgi:hypothetical protein
MYYTRSENDDFKTCAGPNNDQITKMLPEDSDRILPDLTQEQNNISYDNGHHFEQASKKMKKQFSFGGK